MESILPTSCIASVPFDQCSDTTAFGLDPIVIVGAVLLTAVVIAVIVMAVKR